MCALQVLLLLLLLQVLMDKGSLTTTKQKHTFYQTVSPKTTGLMFQGFLRARAQGHFLLGKGHLFEDIVNGKFYHS